MKWGTLTAILAMAASISPGLAQSDTNKPRPGFGLSTTRSGNANLNEQDRQFLTKAVQSNLAEVRLGQLAQERGSSQAVKQFGERMVRDHSRANEELSQIAQKKGMALRKVLDAEHLRHHQKLSRLSGAAFDRQYMSDMLKHHAKDIALFEDEARRGHDADLRGFASRTLPTLREHRQVAQDVHRQVVRGVAATGQAGQRP